MTERISGRVLSVTEELAGSTLSEDAAASDVLLFLEDATYFLEEGGQAIVSDETNSETVTYVSVDLDADTITLETGLVNSYLAESSVDLYPSLPLRNADVQPTGAHDDTIRAAVPTQVGLVLPTGTREDTEREQVLVEYDTESQQFVVRDVYSNAEAESFVNEDLQEDVDCGNGTIEIFDDFTDLGEFGGIHFGLGLAVTDNGDDTVTVDATTAAQAAYYEEGTDPDVTDGDFASTPDDGQLAVSYDTDDDIALLWARVNGGDWKAVEITDTGGGGGGGGGGSGSSMSFATFVAWGND